MRVYASTICIRSSDGPVPVPMAEAGPAAGPTGLAVSTQFPTAFSKALKAQVYEIVEHSNIRTASVQVVFCIGDAQKKYVRVHYPAKDVEFNHALLNCDTIGIIACTSDPVTLIHNLCTGTLLETIPPLHFPDYRREMVYSRHPL